MRKLLVILTVLLSLQLSAQELNTEVTVLFDPQLTVTTIDKEVAKELENSIREFMNTTKWTTEKFDVEERINCNIAITVKKISSNTSFEGNMQVQSTRPGYNSTYNTIMFNNMDEDISFSYQRNAVLQYSENQFRDNLTSILAFYAYLVIGLDFDSFSLNGGDRYLAKAQDIVINAQTSGHAGWKSGEKGRKNRYYIIDNALQELFSPLRQCYYDYHKKGLDKLVENVAEGRKEILKALQLLLKIHSTRPGAINLTLFLNGKRDEMINLFSQAPSNEKTQAVNLLKKMDPSNATRYQKIMEAQ